jgi:hypothetical protein
MWILLPLTWNFTQERMFLDFHYVTFIKLFAAYSALFLVLLAVIIVFHFVGSCLFKMKWLIIGKFVALLPIMAYFFLALAKYIEAREYVPLITSVFFLMFQVLLKGQIHIWSEFMPMALFASIIVLVVIVGSALPLGSRSDRSTNTSSLQTPNIVWIVFDELPINSLVDSNGDVSSDLYPGFSELSDRSTSYQNAITARTWTEKAIPSIFNGKDLNNYGEMPASWLNSLPETTHRIGYSDIGLDICGSSVCASARSLSARKISVFLKDLSVILGHHIMPSALTSHLPSINSQWSSFGKTFSRHFEAEAFLRNIETKTGTKDNFVALAHSLLTHHPWVRDDLSAPFINPAIPYNKNHYLAATCDDLVTATNFFCTDELMKLNKRLSGMNVRSADSIVQRLLRILDESGRFDSTMIVVTADHGTAMATNLDGRRISPSDGHYQDLIKVPLFIKFPDQKIASTVKDFRSTTQILHTVLTASNIPLPEGIDPPLTVTPSILRVNDQEVQTSCCISNTWLSDGGALIEAENPKYPYAIGSAASLMGQSISTAGVNAFRVHVDNFLIDRSRKSPSTYDGKYRNLTSGYIPKDECVAGQLVIVNDGIIEGTAHQYPSFKSSKSNGLWGVSQSDTPMNNPVLFCIPA